MSLPIIAELAAIKSHAQIKNIKQAQHISEVVLRRVINKLTIGIGEVKFSKLIISELKQGGVKALAFEPIVAFGQGAADVHHVPTKNKLQIGDTVMLDFGTTINGYCSDMTRTFFFGEPAKRQAKIYADVLQAQELALKKLKAGHRNCGEIDYATRSYLGKKYPRRAFPHGLGHGVGTAIHEWPTLKPNSKDILKPNMIITIEPGLYFKNWGGIRIEDMVVITKHNVTDLTKFPKDLKSVILKIK